MENNFNITSSSVSDRGLSEKRPENEDSFLVLQDQGVYAVADGVGGAKAGDVASQMAVEIIGEAFAHQSADVDAEDVMRAAIERANSAIYQTASDLPQLSSMATTIVALHVHGNIATIGHVGDSRAYRLDQDGNLRRETDDHSVVEEEVRAGRMTPQQAANHPSKNIISRALGAEPDVDIDLKTIMVEPGTTFLLCSDGITRHIDDIEIGRLLSNGNPASICERMKEMCYARGAEDNLTAVVIRVAADHAPQAVVAGLEPQDAEEATVATSRSPFESTADTPDEHAAEEFAVGDLVTLDDLDDESFLMDDPNDRGGAERLQDYSSSSVIVPAQPAKEPTVSVPSTPAPAPAPVIYRDQVTEQTSSGVGSKLMAGLLLLVLGAIAGAGAHYFWVQSQPERVVEVPVYPEPKSNNIPLTAFEEGRRLVDRDPAHYINVKAASLQTADDHFLMGRAFMLTGKFWEAKRAFGEARNKLAAADPNNAKTLATEISMALAIIESPQATESFSRDVSTASAVGSTNTNSNSVTAPQPIR